MQADCSSKFDTFHLTFDDGPNLIATSTILEALNVNNAKATFFLDFGNTLANISVVARICDEGHTIGIHSVEHVDIRNCQTSVVIAQLSSFVETLQTAVGVAPLYYRPPYGLIAQKQERAIESELGLKTVLWSYDTNDWRCDREIEQIINEAVDSIRPGDVVLMHDGVADAPNPSTHEQWSEKREKVAQHIGELLEILQTRKLESVALPVHDNLIRK